MQKVTDQKSCDLTKNTPVSSWPTVCSKTYLNQKHHHLLIIPILEFIPGVLEHNTWHTLDRMPVYERAQLHPLTHHTQFKDANHPLTCVFGHWEYPEKTFVQTLPTTKPPCPPHHKDICLNSYNTD